MSLLEAVIDQLVDRYGAQTIAAFLGQHMTPKERFDVALRWEIEASFCKRPTMADGIPGVFDVVICGGGDR